MTDFANVEVTITANTEKFVAGVNQATESVRRLGSSAQDLSNKTGAAFGAGTGRNLTATNNAMKATTSTANQLKGAFQKLGIGISAAFAVRTIINFAKESVKAYRESQAAEAKLLAALNGRKDIQESLLKQAKQIQKTTVFNDEAVVNAQAFLAVQGRTQQQIQATIDAAVQLSAVTGEDLNSSVRKLDMTYEGSIGRLGRLDERFKGFTKTQLANGAAIDLINEKYRGMAEAFAQTDAGKIAQLNNSFDDLKESLGAGLSNALADAASRLRLWVGALGEAIKPDAAKEIDTQKQKFILLADAAGKEGLTKERRIELIKQMQAIEPGFLKNLDLEKVTTQQITAAYRESLAVFNDQIRAKKFDIAQQKIYNDLADQQLRIDTLREEAAQKLASGTESQSIGFKEAVFNIAEYGQEASNIIGVWNRFIPAIQEVQAENDITMANMREAWLKSKQAIAALNDELKALGKDGFDDNNARVKELEAIYLQMGGTEGGLAELRKRFENLNDEVADGTTDLTENAKAAGEVKTAYQLLSDELNSLNDLLANEILTNGDNIEQTKQQIILKTELKRRVDGLVQSFTEQLELLGEINRLETKPQIQVELRPTIGPETENDLAKLPENDAMKDATKKMGETAAGNFWNSFVGFLTSNTEEDQKIKGALVEVFDFTLNQITDGLTEGNEELTRLLDERVRIISDSVDDAQDELDRELELNERGLASRVQLKQKELETLKAQQDKAIADRDAQIEKERRQAKTASDIQATAALIKILASAVETGGILGIITGALGVASFLALVSNTAGQASGAVQFAHGNAEILGGKPHTQGGTSLGQYGEAERGEFLGILSKRKTDKYGSAMMNLFNGINKGQSDKIAAGLLDIAMLTTPSGGVTQHNVQLNEVKEIRSIERMLKKTGKSQTYENGRRIERNGNHTRIVYVD